VYGEMDRCAVRTRGGWISGHRFHLISARDDYLHAHIPLIQIGIVVVG
jgi:hypothetical protein